MIMATLNWQTPNSTTGSLDLNNIVTTNTTQTITASKTFTNNNGITIQPSTTYGTAYIRTLNDTNAINIKTGSTSYNGCSLLLGAPNGSDAGKFQLWVKDNTDTDSGVNKLIGDKFGHLTWMNKNISLEDHTHSNYLPLSGGTLTGNILGQSSDWRIINTYADNAGRIFLLGGNGSSSGASMALYGNGYNNAGGQFIITAHDGTNSMVLRGYPDGKLTWGSANLLTSAGGTLNGTLSSAIVLPISRSVDTSYLQVNGGPTTNDGANLILFGKSEATRKGYFYINANNGTTSYRIEGRPDGTLLWGNKDIITYSGGTVSGLLNFEDNGRVNYNINISKGTKPSSQFWYTMATATDTNGTAELNRITLIETALNTTGETRLVLSAYANKANSTDHAQVEIMCTQSSERSFSPASDGTHSLGLSTRKWKQLFASTSTISTSDERVKDNIEYIPNDVLDAWGEVNWYQYQFKDAIKEKGENARLHTGTIAQHIDTIFKSHGLDASRYGLFCYDTSDTGYNEGDSYSLRYEEALCMEAAYQRRRADRLEERIARLEALLESK